MLEKIFINERQPENEWCLSYEKPEFQGGESIIIDEKTAKEILFLKNSKKQITIGKDGTAITAKFEDFINLQESDCGFGDTEKEALIDLLQ